MGRADLAAVPAQPFERGRASLLAAPLNVGSGFQVVMELFDKRDGNFTDADRNMAAAAADFGAEILRHALAERQGRRMLFDAVGAALGTTEKLSRAAPTSTAAARMEQPPAVEVMERLREGLNSQLGGAVDSSAALELAEEVRVLAVRHGPIAVRHCTRVIQSLRDMLDAVTRDG